MKCVLFVPLKTQKKIPYNNVDKCTYIVSVSSTYLTDHVLKFILDNHTGKNYEESVRIK